MLYSVVAAFFLQGVASLNSVTDGVAAPTVRVVTNGAERAELVSTFKSSFRALGLEDVEGCDLLVSEPFGHADFHHSFHAIGGLCTIRIHGKATRWALCADDGVGNLSALGGARAINADIRFLTAFDHDNCVGG